MIALFPALSAALEVLRFFGLFEAVIPALSATFKAVRFLEFGLILKVTAGLTTLQEGKQREMRKIRRF